MTRRIFNPLANSHRPIPCLCKFLKIMKKQLKQPSSTHSTPRASQKVFLHLIFSGKKSTSRWCKWIKISLVSTVHTFTHTNERFLGSVNKLKEVKEFEESVSMRCEGRWRKQPIGLLFVFDATRSSRPRSSKHNSEWKTRNVWRRKNLIDFHLFFFICVHKNEAERFEMKSYLRHSEGNSASIILIYTRPPWIDAWSVNRKNFLFFTFEAFELEIFITSQNAAGRQSTLELYFFTFSFQLRLQSHMHVYGRYFPDLMRCF